MILCLGTSPAVQRIMRFTRFEVDHVNRAAETLEGAGGKFINTAKALTCLGEPALALGIAGGDRGAFLQDTLRAQGVQFRLLPVGSRTRLCTTLIDEAGGTVTELVEENPPVSAGDGEKLVESFREILPRVKALILSGTIAPGLPADLYLRCATLAKTAGLLTVIDAHGEPLLKALCSSPDLVKPNCSELEKTLGRKLRTEAEIVEAMGNLMTLGAKGVVVTRGAEPCLARTKEGLWKIRAPRIKAVNPIGSGDAFTGALTAALLRGKNLGEACRCGAAAGAANALSIMPGVFTRQDYERMLADVSAALVP